MLKIDANAETPVTQTTWKLMPDIERIKLLNKQIGKQQDYMSISINKTTESGQVLVTLDGKFTASKRGIYLLDFERYLKDNVDQGISVWCEAIGDKNSLRNLRGIQIKS
jgi:hypothetical protein